MFKTSLNGKDTSQVSEAIKALGLNGFTGVATLSRELDDNGKVVLENGSPVPVSPYVYVKSATLTPEQRQLVVDAISSCQSSEEVNIAEAPTREMEQIRNHRNGLLAETDWRAFPDVTMSDEWKTYRQELRDVPASNTVYENVTWPTKPE